MYLLEVLSPNFHYSAMKIKVDDKTGIIAIEYKVCSARFRNTRRRCHRRRFVLPPSLPPFSLYPHFNSALLCVAAVAVETAEWQCFTC